MSAWKGLIRQKTLNIDAPIALALIITFMRAAFTRLVWVIGSGYLDSMSGIVFFMLVGRIVQDCALTALCPFISDYKAYFPMAVNVVTSNGLESKNLQDLKERDIVARLYNDEIIPADAVLIKGDAYDRLQLCDR